MNEWMNSKGARPLAHVAQRTESNIYFGMKGIQKNLHYHALVDVSAFPCVGIPIQVEKYVFSVIMI